jgi:hypothetical protein
MGTYSDGSTADITTKVTWTSAITTVATITPAGGLAKAVGNGTSTITASLNGVIGATTLKVRSLTGIAVTPANPVLTLGASQQFTATGTYSDGSFADLTSQVAWNSATPAVATIGSTGLVQALSNGTSTISASLLGVKGSTLLTVAQLNTTLTASPSNVFTGGSVTATWSIVGTSSSTDWIGLYAVGADNFSFVKWVYTTGSASGSLTIGIPADLAPGTYELRLFANNGYLLLATSNPITVIATSATLSASPTAVTGGDVTASWSITGTATSTDWIGLYALGADNFSFVKWVYTTGSASGSLTIGIPADLAPGTYELRLFANSGYVPLAVSNPIVIN